MKKLLRFCIILIVTMTLIFTSIGCPKDPGTTGVSLDEDFNTGPGKLFIAYTGTDQGENGEIVTFQDHSCIKYDALSVDCQGGDGVEFQWDLITNEYDFSGEDMTLTYSYYLESTAPNAPTGIQPILINDGYQGPYFNNVTGLATDAWTQVTLDLTAINCGYDGLTGGAPVAADWNPLTKFRLRVQADAAGDALAIYIDDIKISNE